MKRHIHIRTHICRGRTMTAKCLCIYTWSFVQEFTLFSVYSRNIYVRNLHSVCRSSHTTPQSTPISDNACRYCPPNPSLEETTTSLITNPTICQTRFKLVSPSWICHLGRCQGREDEVFSWFLWREYNGMINNLPWKGARARLFLQDVLNWKLVDCQFSIR